MAEFRARLEVTGALPGRHTDFPGEQTIRATLSFTADPAGGAALVAVVPNLVDVDLIEVELGLFDPAAGNVRARTGIRSLPVTTGQNPDQWFLEAALGAQDFYANGESCVRSEVQFNPPGNIVPTPAVVIGGAALAAFSEAPDEVEAVIRYRPRYSGMHDDGASGRDYFSAKHFEAYVDDQAGEDPANLATFLRRIEREISNTGGVYVTPAGVSVFCCGYATPEPNTIWITPADIGVGTGQIPPDVASNTAARFLCHPGAFYANVGASVATSFEVLAVDTTNAITTSPGAPVLVQITAAPIASRWLFVVDGTPFEVVLAHPAGSDLRRPRDVWNQLITPMITSPAIGAGPVIYTEVVSGGNRTLTPRGVLRDLQRLQYAKFIEPLGPTTAAITSAFVQA